MLLKIKLIHHPRHKKLGLLSLALLCCLPIQAVISAPAQTKPISKANFDYLRRMNDGWKILQEPKIKEKIRSTMGNNEKEFWSCTQLVNPPQIKDNQLLVSAYVRGLAPYMQSLFCLDLVNGKCWVGYLNDSKYHFYGADNFQNLPLSMQQYYKSLEDKTVSLSFEKAHWETAKKNTNQNKSTITPLTYKNPAGSWERTEGNEFDSATMQIKLPKSPSQNKVYFKIEAQSGGNTGEAEGEMMVVDNKATYKSDLGTLHFQFKKGLVVISGDDSSFCGMGVTLLGTYKKVTEP